MMITYMIIAICTIVFIYINFISKDTKSATAMKLGGFYPPKISEDHEYYRFITCHFIHIDFIHFFMNAYCIYSLGGFFESLLGTVGYLYLVIISMLASSLMTYSFALVNERYENSMSIGASGIFYGYLGALIALGLILGGGYLELLYEFAAVIFINVAFTLMNPSISKSGHLGGAIGGFVAIVILIFTGMI